MNARRDKRAGYATRGLGEAMMGGFAAAGSVVAGFQGEAVWIVAGFAACAGWLICAAVMERLDR